MLRYRCRYRLTFILKMYLQKLEIQGFKSFAQKTTMEFTPGITAIVGPNGTGKSNVAEAVRWVLGEQSMKMLRSKKSEDVIFAGSDKKTRMGFCQVDLFLNNENHQAPIDYREIAISRRLYRNGEGEYYINKNKVRLHDILMLLAKSSFGQRSYSIISQGMTDIILKLSPAERKNFLDEAAGVRQFQIKKEQAENKLGQTKENLKQAGLLIQEIEPRLRSLTRQVRRLERREEIEKSLRAIQMDYYSGLWSDFKKKHEEQKARFKQAEEKRLSIDRQVNEIQKEIHGLALGTTREEEFKNLQRSYSQLQDEKNKLVREQTVLKGKMDIEHVKSGHQDMLWLEKRHEEIQREVNNLKNQEEEIQDKIKKHENLFNESNKKQEKIRQELSNIQSKLQQEKELISEKKLLSIPEIAQELDNVFNLQKSFVDDLDKINTLEELKSIKSQAQNISQKLANISQKLKSKGGDPQEILRLQDQLNQILKEKDDVINETNEIKINLQVGKEKLNFIQSNLNNLLKEKGGLARDIEITKKSPSEMKSALEKESANLENEIKKVDQKVEEISQKVVYFNQKEQAKKENIFTLQKKFSEKQSELNKSNDEVNNIKIELAKLETRQEDLEKEMTDELPNTERETIYQTKKHSVPNPDLFTEIQKLKRNLELIGGIDPQVTQEYKETKERYDFLTNQSSDLNKAIEDLEQATENLDEIIKKQFNQSFEKINKEFTKYFKILFNGGNARLSLIKEELKTEEEEEELEELEESEEKKEVEEETKKEVKKGEKIVTGVEVYASPPGKKLKGIDMLSGGERALTSIALICAIIDNNPSPFVFLDEVDAALDESNSIRFASILERLSKKTQFIVITHNRATMHKSGILYGVTMGDDGISRLLSIKMEEAEKVIASRKKI